MATSIEQPSRPASLKILLSIIGINSVVFIALRLCALLAPGLMSPLIEEMALCSHTLAARPWTVAAYMFVQYDGIHFALNMLWLAWFWLLLSDNGISPRRIAATYLAGGFAAATTYAFVSPDGMLVGSSGAVMAIVASTTIAVPRRRLDLPLLRSLRVGPTAAAILAISIAGMLYDSSWSISAHLAGIGAGIAMGFYLRCDSRRPAAHPSEEPDCATDPLLDKLRSSGFASLSGSERLALLRRSSRPDNHHEIY